jgi:glycosyltransferase involved in cell wall biosynthesis
MSAKGGSASGGKKVLLITRPICPPWDEASKNFAFYLAKNLNSFEMYLLTNGYIPDLPSHIHQKPIYSSSRLTHLQRVRLLKLRGILAKNDFDILHYMLTPSKLNSFSFKTFIKNKRAKTIQTIATLREDLLKDKDYKKILFADLIVTYSDYAKNKLNKLSFNNVKRVYPGIDLDLYSPAPKDEETRKNLNLTKKDFVVTYPGEYTRLGATDDLVNLIIKHQDELFKKNIKIIFACRVKNDKDARKRRDIITALSRKKLLEIARFPNTFTTMEKVYNLSDIVLFPVQNMKGKFDIPLVVPEAMACEKPVILSDLPILSELSDSHNSVIIPKGDVESLAQAVFDLYNDPEKKKQIGQKARKFVEERFDIKKIAKIYGMIYEKL